MLTKALTVLEVMLEARSAVSLDQISAMTCVPKPTVFRIMWNLVDRGYVVSSPTGYLLSTKFLRFSEVVASRIDVRAIARPVLERLCGEFGETVHLAELDSELEVLYLDKMVPDRAVGLMGSHVGGVSPAYATGVGKALLAHRPLEDWATVIDRGLTQFTPYTITDPALLTDELRRIRDRGYAVDAREHEIEVACVAAPVRDASGTVIAAVSVSGLYSRMPADLEDSALSLAVADAANQISQALGYAAPHPAEH